MNRFLFVLCTIALISALAAPGVVYGQTYAGTNTCKGCHSSTDVGGVQYTDWSQTLHSKIHLVPDDNTVRPLASFTNGDSISMGASYNNATVYLSKSGPDFFAKVGATGTTYKIAWTYGSGFKQRYLVKIDTSYYILPIQYNLKGYQDNSSGAWVTYNPQKWFKSDGSVKPKDNAFRATSWDKNCANCHVTGGKVEMVVAGTDTSWHSTWAKNSSKENIVVGCESCHGPYEGGGGEGHQMNPSKLATKDAKLEVCGQCHNRASSFRGAGLVGTHEYPKNEVANTYFNPADPTHPLAEFLNFNTPPNATGGPGNWQDGVTARQHHQQYQEFLGTNHNNNPYEEIVCFTCHKAHNSPARSHNITDSLTVGVDKFAVDVDNNTLCLSCHATHGPFAEITRDMVKDPVTNKDAIGTVVSRHSKHDLYDPENEFESGGAGRCSKCHMAKTATSAKAYDIHSHTFNVVPPIQTIKYKDTTTPVKGMLNSCAASCHRNPSGSTSSVPTFGIGTDATLADWSEATDVALAETLWTHWQNWGFTGVKEVGNMTPIAYNLSQNYPNPFNPSTKITVDLPKSGSVRLIVYNILGEVVATLMDGNYGVGKYEVVWNGHDDYGMPAASGVYLYKLEAGAFSKTYKMMMMK